MNTTEIWISTTSKELAQELIAVRFDGASQFEGIRKCFDTVQLYHVIVEVAEPVAIGLFTSWLYDAIKKRPDAKTEIDGKPIQQNITIGELNITVNNSVAQINTKQNKKAITTQSHDRWPNKALQATPGRPLSRL